VKEIRYRPSWTAEKIHADQREILGIFGPWGSGKSTIALWDILLHCQKFPNADVLVIRDTYPALKDSCVTAWMRLFGELGEMKFGPPPDFTWRAGNLKGTVKFRSADDPREIMKFQSVEVGAAWLEECAPGMAADGATGQGIPQEIFAGVFARIRQAGIQRRMICTSLPPPSTHHWLYRLFYERKQSVEGLTDEEVKAFLGMIGKYDVSPEENKEYLPRGYYSSVASLLKSQDQIDRFIHGKVGASYPGNPVFPGYDDTLHRDANLGLGSDSSVLRGWDGGLTPACVWARLTPTGRLSVLAELQGEDIGIEEFADAVQSYGNQLFGPRSYRDFGDRTLENKDQGSGRSAIDYLRAKGIILRPVSNDVDARITAVRSWLGRLGSDGALFKVHPRCERLIEGFRGAYKFREVGGVVTDRPEKNEYSHLHDALQYIAVGLSVGAGDSKKQQPIPHERIDHLGKWPGLTPAISTYRRKMQTHRGAH
jgi:terminase large subunit-like protein